MVAIPNITLLKVHVCHLTLPLLQIKGVVTTYYNDDTVQYQYSTLSTWLPEIVLQQCFLGFSIQRLILKRLLDILYPTIWIIIHELNIWICFFVSEYSSNVCARKETKHLKSIAIKWRLITVLFRFTSCFWLVECRAISKTPILLV